MTPDPSDEVNELTTRLALANRTIDQLNQSVTELAAELSALREFSIDARRKLGEQARRLATMSDPTFEDTPYPYSLAGKWTSVVRALAIVESGEIGLKWGDEHQALGLLQQHPSHFLQFGTIALRNREITVHSTWEEAWIVCCASFLDEMEREHMPLEHAIWAHNIGVEAVKVEGRSDHEYYMKYRVALASFGGTEP